MTIDITNINKRKRTTTDSPKRKSPRITPKKLSDDDFIDDDDTTPPFIFRIFTTRGGGPMGKTTMENTPADEVYCRNPTCNHMTYEEDPSEVQRSSLTEINNICDLITIGKTFHCKKNTEFAGMNLRLMCNLIAPLTELKNMIGMDSVKENVVDQILFFLQGNHVTQKCGKCIDCAYGTKCINTNTDMLHTVITGPPGVGKTELGKIIGKIYKDIGILSTGTFKLVSRSDLIAGYLGQTAIKTQKAIDDAKGGVLFIDEAYSLGNVEQRDSFSKECIDTLNKNLSERRDFLCIIAGYKDELEKCFFKYNDGLKRRFTFKYDIKPYNIDELISIFESKINDVDWKLCYTQRPDDTEQLTTLKTTFKQSIVDLFKKHSKYFPNYGGDIETLFLKCKICHSKRSLFGTSESRRILSVADIENGLKLFSKHRKGENHNKDVKSVYQ